MNKKKFKIDKEETKEFRNWYRKLKPEEKFLARLVERQKDIPPEFIRIIDDHFWELI